MHRITILILLCGFLACNSSEKLPISQTQFLMGTYFKITNYDTKLPEAQIKVAFQKAFVGIKSIEKLATPYDSTSVVYQFNHQNTKYKKTAFPPIMQSLFQQAADIAQKTDGAFDFTLWAIFQLWHFDTDSASVPDSTAITNRIGNVNYQRLYLEDGYLQTEANLQIDFGGIAKGFALEAARDTLKKYGLQNFIIDAGGNLAIEWQKESAIEVQVRHPRKEGEHWGSFPIRNSCGIATSGDYHFAFTEKGKRYHHILNPKTGYPVKDVVSTTIIAPNATLADGYSTAVFVMGAEKGITFLNNHPTLEGMIIHPDTEGLTQKFSNGLKNNFEF